MADSAPLNQVPGFQRTHPHNWDQLDSQHQSENMKKYQYRVSLLTVRTGVLLCSLYSLYTLRFEGHRALHGHYIDRACIWENPTDLVGSLSTDALWLPACTGTGL